MLAKKNNVQNKTPSFGSKQYVLLSAVANTPPKLYKLCSTVFVLSKTVKGLTILLIAATDPRKDDQLAEYSGKSLGRGKCFEETC